MDLGSVACPFTGQRGVRSGPFRLPPIVPPTLVCLLRATRLRFFDTRPLDTKCGGLATSGSVSRAHRTDELHVMFCHAVTRRDRWTSRQTLARLTQQKQGYTRGASERPAT